MKIDKTVRPVPKPERRAFSFSKSVRREKPQAAYARAKPVRLLDKEEWCCDRATD